MAAEDRDPRDWWVEPNPHGGILLDHLRRLAAEDLAEDRDALVEWVRELERLQMVTRSQICEVLGWSAEEYYLLTRPVPPPAPATPAAPTVRAAARDLRGALARRLREVIRR